MTLAVDALSRLQRDGSLYLPTHSDYKQSPPKVSTSKELQADPHSIQVAKTTLVSSAGPTTSGGTSSSATSPGSSQTTLDGYLTHRSRDASTACLEASKTYLIQFKGFDESIAAMIVAPQATM